MKHAAILVCLWLLGQAGCSQWMPASSSSDPKAAGSPAANPLMSSSSSEGAQAPLPSALVVSLEMMTVEVPLGTVSESEELWSYLDEEPAAASSHGNTGRNGLRVGLARRNCRPDLERILKRMSGREVKKAIYPCFPGDPVSLLLKQGQGIQTIFTFDKDHNVSGADYPPGDNFLTLLFTMNLEEPNRVTMVGLPQIRSAGMVTKLVEEGFGPRLVSKPVIYDFAGLTFRLTVQANELVVIGPGAEARRTESVGHHFLIKSRDGMEYETLLILIPGIARTSEHQPPPAAKE